MLTFFTTAKPFHGLDSVIQRNALQSWKLLHPDVEVILFGDEDGASEICTELGLRHEIHVERCESKLPYVNEMFARAQQTARYDFLCYSNCDIILTDDFRNAFQKARSWRGRFLMVARRWDTDVKEPIAFSDSDWSAKLCKRTFTTGKLQIPDYVDFFVFPRGLYDSVPPLIVGYAYWDHWMIWKALSTKCPVLDASRSIVAVHQNHAYTTTPERSKGSLTDALARRNFELSGNGKHLRSIPDATHAMTHRGAILWTPFRRRANTIIELCNKQGFLNHTYVLRKKLGLRKETIQYIRGWIGTWFEKKP